jgi:hypothetical protein
VLQMSAFNTETNESSITIEESPLSVSNVDDSNIDVTESSPAKLVEELKRERQKSKKLSELLSHEANLRKKAEERLQFLGNKHQQIHDKVEREEEGFVNKVSFKH